MEVKVEVAVVEQRSGVRAAAARITTSRHNFTTAVKALRLEAEEARGEEKKEAAQEAAQEEKSRHRRRQLEI